jgi:hypothetical protein
MKIDKKTLAEVVKSNPLATSFFVTTDGHYFINKNKSFAINYCATSGQEMVEVDLEGNQIDAEDVIELESNADYKVIQMVAPTAEEIAKAEAKKIADAAEVEKAEVEKVEAAAKADEIAKAEAEAKTLAAEPKIVADAESLKAAATTNTEKTLEKANATAKAAAPTPKKRK